jgi:predicted protein tyrosine phosphatase
MNFMVLNRHNVTIVLPETNHIIISICEPHKDFVNIPDNKYCKDILQLKYTDEDDIKRASYFGQLDQLFTDKQAQKVIDFVMKYKDEIELIICQCDGGISRSSGTAGALGIILNNDDKFIFNKSLFVPNMFVYRKLLNCYYNKKGVN